MVTWISLVLLTFFTRAASAQDAPGTGKPAVEQIDQHTFRIGKITFRRDAREIRIPAAVNMSEGLLEFALVHEQGKTHESLFKTSASPTDLQLALMLLRFPPSPELTPLPPAENSPEAVRFPHVAQDVKQSARLEIRVEWQDGGTTKDFPISDLIQHIAKSTVMPPTPWVFTGSVTTGGKFAAQATGDMIAIYNTVSAIINYPGEGNRDDTLWQSFAKRVPPPGTSVTLILTPHKP